MPVRGAKNPFPPKGEKGPKMFGATGSGKGPHADLLAAAVKVSPPQPPTRKTTKTLSR
jgi:hypothetical protein